MSQLGLYAQVLLESARRFHKLKEIAEFGIDGVVVDKLAFNWEKVKGDRNGLPGS